MILPLALLFAAACPKDAATTTYLFLPGTSLDGITCYPQLETLSAEDRGLKDLKPLAQIVTLKKLQLSKNAVADLSPLAGLTALEELDIGENDVASLAPVAGMTKLKVLKAQRNRIEDLSPLRALVDLETFIVYDNRIKDVSPLLGLKKLRSFDFERNQIGNLLVLRQAGIGVSENSRQYKGNCLDLLKTKKRDGFAICPPWEDEAARVSFAKVPPGCRVERICKTLVGVDCHSAADGAYDYFDIVTQATIARCGGRCISGDGCHNCPPKQMEECPRY